MFGFLQSKKLNWIQDLKSVFLGYANGTKGYRLWDLTDHKIIISRYVVFKEDSLQKKKVQPCPINKRFEAKYFHKVQDVQTSEDGESIEVVNGIEHRDIFGAKT